ncbi:MAG: serine/threonine-protein kinase [Acidobacteriia bacterium]|nr:serine/threonine-protein kinase [Terriglobia bacterium]
MGREIQYSKPLRTGDRLFGETVLHYQILEKIGEGGMGVVYKALDTRLDRPVAIKALPSIDDPNRRRQFVWEARAAAGLRHPNIVVVHDVASDQGTDFIVMEYIPGRPLSVILAQGRLSVSQALRYAGEVASALESAHAAGIVHRDLKPSNILVTPEGSIKLVDFGLARLQQQDTESQSAVPAIAGTCGYMSPEQAQGARATAQSDIFSFGAVLYEMVTGQRAFNGKSAASVLAAVLRDEPRGIRSLASGCPPELEKIVEQCLRKDPQRRFQHMGDVRLALEEAGPVSRRAHRRIPVPWRRSLLYGAMVTLAMLSGWLLFSRHAGTEPSSMPIPLTSSPGRETDAAWSPDGRQVAFDWNGEKQDNQDIYVMQPGSSQTLRLTTDPGIDERPAWSPDGRWIAYAHTALDRRYSIELISPLGGPTRTLLTCPSVPGVSNWTPDGRAVLVDVVPAPNQPEVVWAVSLDNAKHRQLTWPPPGIPGDLAPAVSPDGKTLAFVRKTAWRTSELYLQDLKPDLSPAGTPRRLTDLGYVARPAWAPDGARILFEAHQEGVGIWQVDRSGKRLRPVFGAPTTATLPAIAKRPSGQTSLIFTNLVARSSIWRYSTEQGPGEPPVELVPSSRSQSHPRYSNDGTRLAFSSRRTGYEEIWVANADGSQPVRLTDLRHQLAEMGHWSPAGDTIAFVSQDRGSRQIYLIGSWGGPAVPITHEDGVGNGSGWSLDGSGYYYDSMRSGRREVWKAPRGGGQPEAVTANGGQSGFESQRGIFYYWRQVPGQGAALMRRMGNGDGEVPLVPRGCAGCVTIPAAEGFYYVAADMNDVYLYAEDTGRSVHVFKRPSEPFFQFTISPDGRWFAYGLAGETSVDLMIMENFH